MPSFNIRVSTRYNFINCCIDKLKKIHVIYSGLLLLSKWGGKKSDGLSNFNLKTYFFLFFYLSMLKIIQKLKFSNMTCYYWNMSIYTLLLLLLSRFSPVQLCATPQTAAHEAPPSLGFSRQEHWSGLPFPSPMHESEKWKGSHSVVSNS